MIFAIAIAIMAVQAKYNNNILSLRKLIKKFLLLNNFFSATLFPNFDVSSKAFFFINTFPKILSKRYNQVNLGYFNLYFNKTYTKNKIVVVNKNIYYINIIFFV